ncbi:MAG TPA: STAS domain-containing protein [Bryobacteraceae bacterium]|jgi:anti-sigma B factor antagonist|nr:STAS domain-containing protein [Bryobacteraceae bacterium]
MGLQIREREVEGIAILGLDGRLVLGYEASGLRKRLLGFIDEARVNVILDLKAVEFIDSTGLGTLVMAHSAMKQAGGAAKLLHLSKRHIELLILTRLTTLFEVFDDETDAINSFFPDREIKRFDILQFVKSRDSQQEEES